MSYLQIRFRWLLLGVVFLLTIGDVRAASFTIERVSVSSTGEEANNSSLTVALSADGRYTAFRSVATNLVANDTNGFDDIFLHDRQTGTTTRISVSGTGAQSNGGSGLPTFSADGRYIAFSSGASNLVSNDVNGFSDAFVRDMQTGVVTLVSLSSSGVQGDGGSGWPVISANGRYVVFRSLADNLVSGDTNGAYDFFVRDRQTNTTTRVTVSSLGEQANLNTSNASISGDGRYVVFDSQADNLVSNDTNGMSDVFLHDLQTGSTTIISSPSTVADPNSWGYYPAISADGRFITFSSSADNFVPGGSGGQVQLYLHEIQTGNKRVVSVSGLGILADSGGDHSSISADGRYVVFESSATNLVAGCSGIFIRDLQNNQTVCPNQSVLGVAGGNDSWSPAISANGYYIAYESTDNNLVPNDNNGFLYDIFEASNVTWTPTSPPNVAPARNYYTSLPFTLTWTPVSWAVGYQVQVATSSNFAPASIVPNLSVTTSTPYLDIPTLDDGVYYWRVCARKNATTCFPWSSIESFTVAAS